MALQVYSTLSRTKEPFRTVEPGKVRMYVCGPTVYKPSHIGHMVGPVIFDTVKRYLTFLGYQVTFIVNITDVDDKLIVRAKELGTTVETLARQMTADYLECLRKLNVTGIDRMPRATEHIAEMIQIMQGLIAKGHAYASGGDVYFDVTSDPDYGKLCNRDPDQLEAGARIEVSDKKRNPGDFALWKAARPGEPAWDSPWGPGRPGWHIECSAMSLKHLGQTLDIHGGGLDLQFPHHENELAQSESYTGVPFARYWMHNGLLRMGKSKMAGSVGNVLNVADLLQKVSGEVLRFFLISTHYRSPIDLGEFDPATAELPPGIVNARKAYDNFVRFFERYQRISGESFFALPRQAAPSPAGVAAAVVADSLAPPAATLLSELAQLRQQFLAYMDDDFNTGGAIGVLYEMLTAINRYIDSAKLEAGPATPEAKAVLRHAATVLRELAGILGLFEVPPEKPVAHGALVEGLLQLLVELRQQARQAKNFTLADTIRKRLAELGVTLEDRASGTVWRIE
jgi:cysteinyl-tRNA synthetase